MNSMVIIDIFFVLWLIFCDIVSISLIIIYILPLIFIYKLRILETELT